MKILFIGNGTFGVPSLEKLHEIYQVTVITTPPRRSGRVVQNTPIYIAGKALGCLVYTADNINELEDYIIDINFDLIVVASYGQIIKMKILDSTKYGAINIHGSLLPKYRGASCIQAAILNRDAYIGVSYIKMNEKMDAGPVIYRALFPLKPTMTYPIVLDELSKLAAKHINLVIMRYTSGYRCVEQPEKDVTFCNKITKDDGLIDFNKTPKEIFAQFNAYEGGVGIFFYLTDNNTTVKIKELVGYEQSKIEGGFNDGELICVCNKTLFMNCKGGSIKINQLQLPGKKTMFARDFINGYKHLIPNFLTAN